ncbi:hypothetical protein [Streptomyces cylindrosporus]|uniref:Uncharacterized protein n=1 Tax=Streptomyces cylindrosporus TaxID=2927583 RepID=A0ABS9YPJ3_9ACTN|nr:hypothetical protein [Streptomyces cylindrosporus]MCI3279186.1 hypothetical protein [Streptomyces cylindrosporus]
MTTTPETEPAVDVPYADAVLAARAMSSAVFLAGLIANGQLETVGRPDRLPQDLFPHVDADVVQAIWDRALAVGLHAGRVSASPRLHRDQLARVQGQFEAIGFEAMARSVGRSRRLVAAHPADGEGARARADGVTSPTSDTREGT